MAQAAGLLDHDQFSCSICLDLLKDPVTIPCGHSYCLACIQGCWHKDDHTGVYSCPQCRQTFSPRPVLNKNTMLDEVVGKLKKTGLQAALPAQRYAGSADVECDICTGRKCKAVKSCLACLASYCEIHLQPHHESAPLKKHKLVKPIGNLQEKICSHHDKLLEIFCRTDQLCICYLCTTEDHKGHDSVSVAMEITEKKKQLVGTQSEFQRRIQEREKELQDLRQAVQSLKRSAQAAVADSERIFAELIRSFERRRSEVKALIRDQEKAAVSRAEGLLQQLEQEIAELKRRDAEMEQLFNTDDHIYFLQSFTSVGVPPGPGDLPYFTVNPRISFDTVRKYISELNERLEDACKEETSMIFMAGTAVGTYGCFTETGEVGACPLCTEPLQKKQRLMCTHTFCAACLERSVERLGLQCPVCLKALRVVGNQPEGEMIEQYCTNFAGQTFFHIGFNFPRGIQMETHPNPGKPFTGSKSVTLLPINADGEHVLTLLRKAFNQKLVFTVVATDEEEDRVVFNDIPNAEGWCDCNDVFLEKVKVALRAKGIE